MPTNLRPGAVLLLLFAFLLTTCTKSDDEGPEEEPVLEDFVLADDVDRFLPREYYEGRNIVFVNEEGLEWVFMTQHKRSTEERTHHAHTFETEVIDVDLFDHKNSGFQIKLSGSAYYYGENTFQNHLTLGFKTPNSPFTINNFVLRFIDGEPEQSGFTNYRPTLTLLQRPFNGVYRFRASNTFSYSEININEDFGVIAFRDRFDFLWVFDRFE